MHSLKLNITGLLVFLAALLPFQLHADPVVDKHAQKTLVLDIQITGDSTVKGDIEDNLHKIAKFSAHLREQLQDKTRFDVVLDENALQHMGDMAQTTDLHNCNGCEGDLATELGAGLVFMPTVFRMSHLISTLHVDVKDAETGRLLHKKAYDFRGNTDKAWERAIKYAMRDLAHWAP